MGFSPGSQGPPVRTGGPVFSDAFVTRSSPVIGVGGSPSRHYVQNSVFDLKRGNVWSKLDSLKREPG